MVKPPQPKARIFFSFKHEDEKIVNQYADRLINLGYEILRGDEVMSPGDSVVDSLLRLQQSADVTISFLTENGVKSQYVMNELGIARSYMNDKPGNYLLIPVVDKKIEIPFIVANIRCLLTSFANIEKDVDFINNSIVKYFHLDQTGKKKQETKRQKVEKGETTEPVKGQKHDIKTIQQALSDLDYYTGALDGVLGPETKNAIKSFQNAYGLEPGGELDEKSIRLLITAAGERNKESGISGTSEMPPSRHFWLMVINEQFWPIHPFEIGQEMNVNLPLFSDKKDKNDQLIFNLNQNDQILGFDPYKENAILADFTFKDVITQLSLPDNSPVSIRLLVREVFVPPIEFSSFREKIPFGSELGPDAPIGKIFPLSAALYTSLSERPETPEKEAVPLTEVLSERFTLSRIDTDSSSAEIPDKLGFENDYKALAKTIAYSEVRPPLAIGLFGNWGTGKSFFMNKLEGEIETLRKRKSNEFCKEIVQIKFNSWHYSDSNLWASLVTKIFEDLKKYGEKDKDKLRVLLENLNSTKDQIADIKQKQKTNDSEIELLKRRQIDLNLEIKKKVQNLNGLGFFDIAKVVMNSENVSTLLKELKDKYGFLDIRTYDQIGENIQKLRSTGGKLQKCIQLIITFKSGKLWIALLTAIVFLVGSAILIEKVKFFQETFGNLKLLFVPFGAYLSQLIVHLGPTFKFIDRSYDELLNLQKTCQETEQKKLNEHNNEVEELKSKIDNARIHKNILKEQLDHLELRKAQLNTELNDIVSGRKVLNFIESRMTDEKYINSLGIISWVRKDFEELDFLLKQQHDAERLKQFGRTKVPNVFKIDRIILYIDDLDRCEMEIVVRVLEAIHLLLAFELFVVVVGVDPRWMHNALLLKYKTFLNAFKDNTGKIGLPETFIEGKPATSYDYLEKIFQIPFVLKPMDRTGIENLIEEQFRKKAKIKEEDQNKEAEKRQEIPVVPVQDTLVATEKTFIKSTDMIAESESKEKKTEGMGLSDIKKPEPTESFTVVPVGGEPPAKPPEENKPEEKETLLEVSEEEIKFMQSIGFLIGDSPRTIKRYVNMYRIIRTHSNFRFVDNNINDHYYAAMILLAVITGIPESSKIFFSKVISEQGSTYFVDFIKSCQKIKELKIAQIKTLHGLISKDKPLDLISKISMEKFQINIHLISRFSFRNLI